MPSLIPTVFLIITLSLVIINVKSAGSSSQTTTRQRAKQSNSKLSNIWKREGRRRRRRGRPKPIDQSPPSVVSASLSPSQTPNPEDSPAVSSIPVVPLPSRSPSLSPLPSLKSPLLTSSATPSTYIPPSRAAFPKLPTGPTTSLPTQPLDSRCRSLTPCSNLRKRDCNRCFRRGLRRNSCLTFTTGVLNIRKKMKVPRKLLNFRPWLRGPLRKARSRKFRPDVSDLYCIGFYQLYVNTQSDGQLDVGDSALFHSKGAGVMMRDFIQNDSNIIGNVSVTSSVTYNNAGTYGVPWVNRRLSGAARLPIAANQVIRSDGSLRLWIIRRTLKKLTKRKDWLYAFNSSPRGFKIVRRGKGVFIVDIRFTKSFQAEF